MSVVAENTQKALCLWCQKLSEGKKLFSPSSVALRDDSFYFIDQNEHQIVELSCDGSRKRNLFKKGNEAGAFYYPSDIFFSDDFFFVTDKWNHRVQTFDQDWNFQKAFGSYGSREGQFNEPCGLVVCGKNLFVVEKSNGRVQKFDLDGNFISSFQDRAPLQKFYESESFKTNEHYLSWSQKASRYQPIETYFKNAGFQIGMLEFPEKIFEGPEGLLIVNDQINHVLSAFDQDLHLCSMPTVWKEALKKESYQTITFWKDKNVFLISQDNKICQISPEDKKCLYEAECDVTSIHAFGSKVVLLDFWNGQVEVLEWKGD